MGGVMKEDLSSISVTSASVLCDKCIKKLKKMRTKRKEK
jgi:hypothetical protein